MMRMSNLPPNTPHDVLRAIALLESSGFEVRRRRLRTRPQKEYDAAADSAGSYDFAQRVRRDRYRAVVKEFVPKLRVARGKLGISGPRFAPQLGVSVSYFRKLENGREIAAPAVFDRWRNLLGL
jgi:ribosome-binding protein aMBF1 (putative translation factor)